LAQEDVAQEFCPPPALAFGLNLPSWSHMADEFGVDESIIARVNKLGSELGSTRVRLQQELDSLTEQCVAKQREVETQAQRLEEFQRALPAGSDDEVLNLDVAGRRFKARRSTLSQFEGSVLATLASTRWADAAKSDDGCIFLDMDPSAFEEVLTFLRERRLSRHTPAVFTCKAARLAEYLGVPVDSRVDETCVGLQLTAALDRENCGLMFDLSMPSFWGCSLRALSIRTTSEGTLTIYTHKGSFLGAPQTDGSKWSKILEEARVEAGNTRVALPWNALHVAPFATVAVCLFCANATLQCSSKTPALDYVNLSQVAVSLNERMKLLCGQVRTTGSSPFDDVRYFVGAIEYVIA